MINFGAFSEELENIMMEKIAVGPVNPGTRSLFGDMASRFLKKSPQDVISSRAKAGAREALQQQGKQNVMGAFAKKHGRSIGKTAMGKMIGAIKKIRPRPSVSTAGVKPLAAPKQGLNPFGQTGPSIPGFSPKQTAQMAASNDFSRVM